jgi:hypothetical protein
MEPIVQNKQDCPEDSSPLKLMARSEKVTITV